MTEKHSCLVFLSLNISDLIFCVCENCASPPPPPSPPHPSKRPPPLKNKVLANPLPPFENLVEGLSNNVRARTCLAKYDE